MTGPTNPETTPEIYLIGKGYAGNAILNMIEIIFGAMQKLNIRIINMLNEILILGGNGYIGSALKEHLVADSLDITDFKDWPKARWDVEGYKTVILLAGHSSMPLGRDDPNGAWRNNVNNFKNL